MALRVAIFLFPVVAFACRPAERPACSVSTLASIEAAYVAEALTVCRGQTFESCAALPALEEKYAAQREEWIACR